MAAYTTTSSIYDAMKSIVDTKGKWHNAASQGQNPSQYEEEAKKYYEELEKAGGSSIAEQLHGSDYTKASDILSQYTKDLTVTPAEQTKITQPDTASQGVITAATDLYNYGKDRAGTVEAQSDTAYNTFLDYFNKYSKQGDDLVSAIQAGYSETPETKAILGEYETAGKTAADSAYASGASENAGNPDTYAESQSATQKLAYTNAGVQAAVDAWNDKIASWTNALNVLGVNAANLQQNIQANVDSARTAYITAIQNAMSSLDSESARENAIAQIEKNADAALEEIAANAYYRRGASGTISEEEAYQTIIDALISKNYDGMGGVKVNNIDSAKQALLEIYGDAYSDVVDKAIEQFKASGYYTQYENGQKYSLGL